MSLFMQGRVYKVNLYWDASGSATTGSQSRLGQIFTSLAGYPFASFSAYFFLYLVNQEYFIAVGVTFIVLLSCLTLTIRNLSGFLWLIFFLIPLVLCFYFEWYMVLVSLVSFLIATLIVQSTRTAWTIFFLSLTQRKQAGDATNLASLTYIPAAIWGCLFFIQSLFFTGIGIEFWI